LTFAQNLDDTTALQSASYGTAQIMGFNYASIGYSDVQTMFLNFSSSIRSQLQGLFAFIQTHSACLNGLRSQDYLSFAQCYNGNSPNAQMYGDNIQAASQAYDSVLPDALCSINNIVGVCQATSASCAGGAIGALGQNGCVASLRCCALPINETIGMYNGTVYGLCHPASAAPGACYDTSRCAGNTYSSLCPGGSNIKCCVRDACLGAANGGGGIIADYVDEGNGDGDSGAQSLHSLALQYSFLGAFTLFSIVLPAF